MISLDSMMRLSSFTTSGPTHTVQHTQVSVNVQVDTHKNPETNKIEDREQKQRLYALSLRMRLSFR